MSSFEDDCRMYEKKFPEENELVMVKIKSIGDMGVYVSLLEYNNIEGMILLSEISRRRIRSINKLVRVGRTEAVVVVRVDKEKGYIDLSKRRVTPEEYTQCEERYHKSKAVHGIIRTLAGKINQEAEAAGASSKVVKPKHLYKKFCWPLYRKYNHAFEAFKLSITEPSILEEFEIPENERKLLNETIVQKLKPQPHKVRADLELTCFDYEGIDAIKHSILAAQSHALAHVTKVDNPDEKTFGVVTIKLVAPPLYVMVGTFDEKEKGLAMVTKCVEVLGEEITKKKGNLVIKVHPRVVEPLEKALNSFSSSVQSTINNKKRNVSTNVNLPYKIQPPLTKDNIIADQTTKDVLRYSNNLSSSGVVPTATSTTTTSTNNNVDFDKYIRDISSSSSTNSTSTTTTTKSSNNNNFNIDNNNNNNNNRTPTKPIRTKVGEVVSKRKNMTPRKLSISPNSSHTISLLNNNSNLNNNNNNSNTNSSGNNCFNNINLNNNFNNNSNTVGGGNISQNSLQSDDVDFGKSFEELLNNPQIHEKIADHINAFLNNNNNANSINNNNFNNNNNGNLYIQQQQFDQNNLQDYQEHHQNNWNQSSFNNNNNNNIDSSHSSLNINNWMANNFDTQQQQQQPSNLDLVDSIVNSIEADPDIGGVLFDDTFNMLQHHQQYQQQQQTYQEPRTPPQQSYDLFDNADLLTPPG
eukprot:gene10944-13403_t